MSLLRTSWGHVVPASRLFLDISVDLFVTLVVTVWEGEEEARQLSKKRSNTYSLSLPRGHFMIFINVFLQKEIKFLAIHIEVQRISPYAMLAFKSHIYACIWRDVRFSFSPSSHPSWQNSDLYFKYSLLGWGCCHFSRKFFTKYFFQNLSLGKVFPSGPRQAMYGGGLQIIICSQQNWIAGRE